MTPSRGHVWFTLFVLFAINTMNFFDRQVGAAVQENIKKDWDLTDTELGWLGTAFILLYAVVGVPLGRLTDLWRRKWILATGIGVWSLMTAGSGFAQNFWQLFWLRLGVGVGEAACAPVASSLIGDLVKPEKRARAMGFFMIGLPLGLSLSLFVGGTVAHHYGWQYAFFLAGLPGLLLAFAALFMLDPPRGGADVHHLGAADAATLPFLVVVREVLRLPTMWWIIASGAVHNFNMYALGTFIASFYARYHGLDVQQAGYMSGWVYGFGAIGIFGAGWLGDFIYHKRVNGRMTVAWVSLALAIPCLLVGLGVARGSTLTCTVWLLIACVLMYAYYGTVYATIQDIIAPSLRGMAMALYFCAMYLGGAIWGPVATGWISDLLASRAAEKAGVAPTLLENGRIFVPDEFRAVGLHQAMYILPILCGVLVLVLFAASRTVARDRQKLLARRAAGEQAR